MFSQIAAKIRGMNQAAAMANRATAMNAGMATRASQTASAANAAIIGAAGRVLAPAAIAAGAGVAYKNFADADLKIKRIGITADATEQEVSSLSTALRETAKATGQSFGEVTKGLESLTAGGMDLKEALPAIPAIAKTAQAAGAEVEDMATTTLALNQNLGIATDKMQNAFDILVKGGKAGKFELKDMARYFPSIAPAAVAAGMKGEEGLMRIVAALQTIRNGTGTTEEAASSMQNIFAKMESEETTKKFKKFGIDLRKEMTKARAEGKDLLEVFTKLSDDAIKGDLSKVPQLFSDMEFARGMRALLSYQALNRKVTAELKTSAGSTQKDFEKIMDTPAIAMKRMGEAMDRAINSAGGAIDKLAKKFGPNKDGLAGILNDTAKAFDKFGDKPFTGVQDLMKDEVAQAKRELVDERVTSAQATVDRLKGMAEKYKARTGEELPEHRKAVIDDATTKLIEAQRAKHLDDVLNRKPLFGPDDPEANMWRKSGPGEVTEIRKPGVRPRAPGDILPTGPMPSVQPLEAVVTAPVTAELNGSADVKGEVVVKVEPSSSLLTAVDTIVKLAGKLTANGPGSTGKSSPDAAPNSALNTGMPLP
ncbi:phage tail tape measure protein [Bradyrhizobium arachidis]|uniref:phage tail tape measure protein n=1 Tax=Bradyrhizobium arachidis TaxID=858423 RepID=UPI002162910F|nr:phage tail tape measure protein [Bradyrhizobium arachidis]UVO29917.1 phage tail tape measure protein [Bradyrhizobium arachidis]